MRRTEVNVLGLLLPFRRETRMMCKDKRWERAAIQYLDRALTSSIARISPFKQTALECIDIKVTITSCLLDIRFHGFDGVLCKAVRLRVVWG